MCSPSSRAQWTCIRGLFSSRTEDNELLPVAGELLFRLYSLVFPACGAQKLDSGGGLTLVSHSGLPVALYQFTTHPPSDDIVEKRELRGWFWSGAAPRHCLACGHRPYQKRTKYRQIYRYFRLLTLSNLFTVNSRRVDGERVKMALYR